MHPLQLGSIPLVVEAIRLADAQRNLDLERALEIVNERMKATADEEQEAYIEDFLPEYYKDLRRMGEILTDGRVCDKVFDMAPAT